MRVTYDLMLAMAETSPVFRDGAAQLGMTPAQAAAGIFQRFTECKSQAQRDAFLQTFGRVTEFNVASEAAFGDGDPLVIQGQVGTGLFIIVSGGVRISQGGADLTQLGPGDYLGELSVIDREPRSASAFAVGPTACLALASWDLFRRVDADRDLSHALLRGLALRVRSLSDHLHH